MLASLHFTLGFTLRCSRFAASTILFFLGSLFCTGNLWFTAVRSTIPIALRGTILEKEHFLEKKKGVDDVYLLRIEENRTCQVDAFVFAAVNEKNVISKSRWDREMLVDGNSVPLGWSLDFRSMIFVMSLACIVMSLINRIPTGQLPTVE